MSQKVCMGALLKCSCGLVPTPLIVTPQNKTITSNMPTANIMDNKPTNIATFGMCSSPANPAVAAAIAASQGSVTKAPCKPVTPAPWLVGDPTLLINNFPALTNNSKLMCIWGGVIEISMPGQMTVQAE